METSYYRRGEREALLEKTKNVKTLQEIKDFIYNDILEEREAEVHIGKSSCGWQFLFHLGIRKYTCGQSLKREDIDKWLRSGIIVDEYEDEISADKFWQLVDTKKDGMNYDEYYKNFPEDRYCRDYDQQIDGLRFTKDETEFS